MRAWTLWIAAVIAVVSGAVWAVARSWNSEGTMNSGWKAAWFGVLISALTDFILAFAGGVTSGNAASQTTYPTGPTIFYSTLFALGVAFRRIDQAFKATSADSAALRGIESVVITKTPGQTEIAGTPEPGQVQRSAQHVAPPKEKP